MSDVCSNPDVLKVIMFIWILIKIVMIIVPIGIILMGLIDLSKSTVTSDDAQAKKNLQLFVKRLISGVLVMATPWIVETFINILGDVAGDSASFTKCLTNANNETIEALEKAEASKEETTKKNTSSDTSGNTASGNSSSNNSGSSSSGSSTTNKETTTNTILVGDSRTVGMCMVVTLSSSYDCSIAKESQGYDWLTTKESEIKSKLDSNSNSNIVFNLGVNDISNVNKYASFYNTLASTYPKANVVVVSVTPVEDAKASGYYVRNSDVINFNTSLKNNLNSNITYCDVYSSIIDNFSTEDGVHYTTSTYQDIFNEIKKCL